jgi:hypothetical protein
MVTLMYRVKNTYQANVAVKVQGWPPSERTKDTRDKGSHEARFIF